MTGNTPGVHVEPVEVIKWWLVRAIFNERLFSGCQSGVRKDLPESLHQQSSFTKILRKLKCKTFILGPTIIINKCRRIVSILKCIIEVSN